jgi:hypothetical protein
VPMQYFKFRLGATVQLAPPQGQIVEMMVAPHPHTNEPMNLYHVQTPEGLIQYVPQDKLMLVSDDSVATPAVLIDDEVAMAATPGHEESNVSAFANVRGPGPQALDDLVEAQPDRCVEERRGGDAGYHGLGAGIGRRVNDAKPAGGSC